MELRHVHLDEFEMRVKKFVYDKPLIKLKQMEEAFKGNKHLETAISDKEGLDWRLLTIPGLFMEPSEDVEDEEGRDPDSMNEDPELTFRVNELMLLAVLYCRSSPRNRIKKFYALLQCGMDPQISAQD